MLDTISVEGISRSNPLKAARAVGRAATALTAARKILKRRQADAVRTNLLKDCIGG